MQVPQVQHDYETVLHAAVHSDMRICSEPLECGHSVHSVGYMCASHNCNWAASAHYDRMIDRVYGTTQTSINIRPSVRVDTRCSVLCKRRY
jgi:hypothetical protein